MYGLPQETILSERCLSIRKVAEDIGISISTCHEILTEDLLMRQTSVKPVPHLVAVKQKDDRISVGTDLHEWARNDPKSMSSIADDETWVHGYDQETKQMSSQLQPTSFPQLKVWEVTFNVKTVLLVIFDFDGLAHHIVCPLGAEYEYWILQNGPAVPPRSVSWHYPEKWCISNWVLKHDNVPVHRSSPHIFGEITFHYSYVFLTLLTWLYVKSSCSTTEENWNVIDSIKLKRFKPEASCDKWGLLLLLVLQNVPARGAFIISMNAGISAYTHMGTSLKEIIHIH